MNDRDKYRLFPWPERLKLKRMYSVSGWEWTYAKQKNMSLVYCWSSVWSIKATHAFTSISLIYFVPQAKKANRLTCHTFASSFCNSSSYPTCSTFLLSLLWPHYIPVPLVCGYIFPLWALPFSRTPVSVFPHLSSPCVHSSPPCHLFTHVLYFLYHCRELLKRDILKYALA